MSCRRLPSGFELGLITGLGLIAWSTAPWITGMSWGVSNPIAMPAAFVGMLLMAAPLGSAGSRPIVAITLTVSILASPLHMLAAGQAHWSRALAFVLSAMIVRLWWEYRARTESAAALASGALLGTAASISAASLGLALLPLGSIASANCSWRSRLKNAGWLCAGLAIALQFGGWTTLTTAVSTWHPSIYWTAAQWLSSEGGLLYSYPLLWLGGAGILLMTRDDFRTFWPLAAAFATVTLLGLFFTTHDLVDTGRPSGPWPLLMPPLVLGLSHGVLALAKCARNRPAYVMSGMVAAFFLWNLLLMEQYRRFMIPRDDTIAFARVAANSAVLTSRSVGCPLSWPLNWWLSRCYDTSLESADRLAGKRLFSGATGVVDLGDERVDATLLQEGWSRPLNCEGVVCRAVQGPARILLPIERPARVDVLIRAGGVGTLSMALNGRALAQWPLTAALAELRATITEIDWKTPMSQLVFDVSPNGTAFVDRILFKRRSGRAS
jgi:hypothetical protein